ncbi:bifunctional lysylphosphatidylglycerol flippase/synthetase MprF [Pseudonocardia saturnea]
MRRFVRQAPLTVGYTVLALLLGVLTGSLPNGPGPAVLDAVGTGVSGHWWSPVAAIPLWGGLAGHLVTAALVLGAGLVAERRIGALRTAALLVGTQVVGTLLTLGAVTAGAAAGGAWAGELATQLAVGGAPGAVGLLLAVSHVLSALWRRRIRLVLLVGVVMLVAYSGELTDALLLFSAVTGLAAGPLVLRRAAPMRAVAPSRAEGRVLVALVVAASAVGPVVAAVAQDPIGPLSVLQFVVLSPPPDAATVQQICATAAAEVCRSLQAQLRLSGIGPAIASAVPVLLLLVTAEGLRRGRRAAWIVGIALNLVLAVLGVLLAVQVTAIPAEQLVVYGGAPGARQVLALVLPPLLPLAVAGLLVLTRARFPVRAPAGTYRRLTAVAAATLVGVGALYVVGGALVADGFDRPPRMGELAADLPLRFLPPGYLGEVEPAFLPQYLVATLLFEWSGAVFWLVVAAGLLRSFVAARPEGGSADADRARELLRRHGGSHLGWLTTWPGHTYWFAAHGGGGDAAVAYRVIGSVAVTTGDPFGDPEARTDAVAGFAAHCAERGLTPAFYSVTDDTRAACAALGWSALQVAEETVIALPGLAFTGKRWQDVRSALNRAARTGTTAEWISYRHAPLALTDQIRAISEEWVADLGLPEMGFTLGGLDELDDDDVRCLVAVDADRTVHGVTSWLPVHADGAVTGWTLDFMRRRSGTHGVMEFLIASAAQTFRDEGALFASLSGAPLAQLDSREVDGVARVLDLAGHALEPVYGFRSLLAFKAKFQPRYDPLYLAYPDPVALPAIGVAVGRAYLPDLTARQSARLVSRMRDRAPHG